MKTIFTLFSLSLILAQAFGQNFSVSATDTTFYGEIDDTDFAAKFILYNDSTDAFPMTWEVVSETMEAGWDYSICDPTECHPIGATTSVFNLPTTASNRIMNIHYFPNEIFGESTVVVKIWENAYPDDFVLLEWTGIVAAVGLNGEDYYHSLTAFAQNQSVNVQYQLASNGDNMEFVLYDLTGKIVDQKQILDTTGMVSLGENLESGVYVYRLLNNGHAIISKKIAL
ncbi:MAG: hypothetical protein ACI8ZM_003662 [Crocinitomix sp.]|jgi:hypothetical protein